MSRMGKYDINDVPNTTKQMNWIIKQIKEEGYYVYESDIIDDSHFNEADWNGKMNVKYRCAFCYGDLACEVEGMDTYTFIAESFIK